MSYWFAESIYDNYDDNYGKYCIRVSHLGSDCLARVEGGTGLDFFQQFDDAAVAAIRVCDLLGQHFWEIAERQVVLTPQIWHGSLAIIFALVENFLQFLFVPAGKIIRVHGAGSVGERVSTALQTSVPRSRFDGIDVG